MEGVLRAGQSPLPSLSVDKERPSQWDLSKKLVETLTFYPVRETVCLLYNSVKLITWTPITAGLYLAAGYHTESVACCENQLLETAKVVRNILAIPSLVKRTVKDLNVYHDIDYDTPLARHHSYYLQISQHEQKIQKLSSYLYGLQSFPVIYPIGLTEYPALHDANLKMVMASHLFKPGVMAINFGCPNVATFITVEGEDGMVQTEKVDAKSLCREPMKFHPTNGKIQSGVFLVPTNLPEEALSRFKEAAATMQSRKDVTCVNTNARVLKEAGFSVEGVDLVEVRMPDELLGSLLHRRVFYTDLQNNKHKVLFDIVNTTKQSIGDYFNAVDTAVVATPLRHLRRHADSTESQKARGEATNALIREERERLKKMPPALQINEENQPKWRVTVSVQSYFGQVLTKFLGSHTLYELDLSQHQAEIRQTFEKLARDRGKEVTLRAFPDEKPDLGTLIKRDVLFSGPVVSFLRRHLMGRVDTLYFQAQDVFNHLKWTNENDRLNYVLLDHKMIVAAVRANTQHPGRLRKRADWALTKHRVLAGDGPVLCSGEMHYNKTRNVIVLNWNSGTFKPDEERVKKVVEVANKTFETEKFGLRFEVEQESLA